MWLLSTIDFTKHHVWFVHHAHSMSNRFLSSDKKSWIVCDGDIDPEWVESLNSVLDDNRLLTLPSGERIQFGGNINFVFETHELACASPATVSRMGVVFISDEMLDPKALVNAWLQKQPEEDRPHLENLINPAYYTCLEWLRCKVKHGLSFQTVVSHMNKAQKPVANNKVCLNSSRRAKISFFQGD